MHSTRNGTVGSWRHSLADTVRFASSQHGLPHRAFIALGSNMGDRVAMIEQACKEVDASNHVKILRTSSLYETKAMYVLDQDNFVNGACEVDEPTTLQ
jgi:2-amino-4-hydroxy-6-hydroxymethyldihydropteridine diphosphokinase / dihydropteroate synthase